MGLLRSVGVVLHPTRMNVEAVSTLLAWADRASLPVYGLPDEVGRLDCAAQPVAPEQLAEMSSLLVSLGGDGTMLRTMRLSHRGLTPVLGVNFGRLGFLAEVDLPDLPKALEAIDHHDFTVEARTAVTFACGAVEAAEDEHAHDDQLAFNDVALVRNPGHGSAVVELVVRASPFRALPAADAVIVATAYRLHGVRLLRRRSGRVARVEGLLSSPPRPTRRSTAP